MLKPQIDSNGTTFGTLLKQWRHRRRFSQLNLALSSEVSQRHISFLESGRAKPSQEIILQLATVLEIPLRQQNRLLSAAGFAPIFAETDLSAPEMSPICKALDFILRQQEPYPAIVIDRYWNLLKANQGATRLFNLFMDPVQLQTRFCREGKINLMHLTFDPEGLRPFIVNWEELVGYLLKRVHREANSSIGSEQSSLLLNELIRYPGISDDSNLGVRVGNSSEDESPQNDLILSLHLKKNDLNLRFFSTIATLGTPYDITLQEIRIECFFPVDEITEHNWNFARQFKSEVLQDAGLEHNPPPLFHQNLL